MEIKDKVALVLGGSRGIGRALAQALAEAGAKIVLPCHYDWPKEAEELKRDFAGPAGDHLVCRTDLRDQEQVRELVNSIRDKYGALHILINNIERGGMPVVHGYYDHEVNREQWALEMDTTLKAKWLVVHHGLPLMQDSTEGVIINISSIAGLVGRTGPAGLLFSDGYAAASRAVSVMTETWAREAAPKVRVNELMLGFFETRHGEGTRGWEILPEAARQAVAEHTLLKRTGCLDDVVRAVLFLIRDAVFMTGSVLRLDGGYVLGGEQVPPMPAGALSD